MKKKLFRWLALCLSMALCLMTVSCGTNTGDKKDSSVSESAGKESEDTADETDQDTEVLTLDNGTEITLTSLDSDSVGIYGYYTCDNDGSKWVFGGNNLAVAYTDENGALNAYVCSIDFYQTEAEEDGDYYLCALMKNVLEGTTTVWYVMNILDDNGNSTGMVLRDPGNEEEYIYLTLDNADKEE